ncbi:MAG: hypothetical protein AVDCRST_MAG71-154, partial [uncultured Lysobacter sp.]
GNQDNCRDRSVRAAAGLFDCAAFREEFWCRRARQSGSPNRRPARRGERQSRHRHRRGGRAGYARAVPALLLSTRERCERTVAQHARQRTV